MKAIVPLIVLSAALAACAAPPRPAPAPRPVVIVPRPAPAPPPPPPSASNDWRDQPQTPGTWRWAVEQGRSTARFVGLTGQPLALLQCDRASASVWLGRSGTSSAPVLMVVRTTGAPARSLTSRDAPAPAGWIGTQLPARDPLLDAIAFSRGRFALETAGLPTLYLPAWPELSRVVEDCR